MSEEEIEEIEEKYWRGESLDERVTPSATVMMHRGRRNGSASTFCEPAWADKLVAAIEPAARRPFLEIGPGPGALTLRLAPRVRKPHGDRDRSPRWWRCCSRKCQPT